MKKTLKIGLSILALAAACSAHPGHEGKGYGVFWKRPASAHTHSPSEDAIWRYAFVSVYQWNGSR
jgi:hypothetical protein